GVVALIEVLLTKVTLVAAVAPKATVAPAWKFAPVMVTTVPPAVVPETGDIELIVGTGAVPPCPAALNVATCITHFVLVDMGAEALLFPMLPTTRSSAMSPSGEVMILEVNPVPAAVNRPAVIPAPKINSL